MERRSGHIIMLTTVLVLCWSCLGGTALAERSHAGAGYAQALQAHRESSSQTRTAPARSAAEKRAIRVWGRAVGRWYDCCARYFPRAQLQKCMFCIKHESGGNPKAYNRNSGAKGLFQLLGYKCSVWRPETNIRLAAKLWRARGWEPWVVMR